MGVLRKIAGKSPGAAGVSRRGGFLQPGVRRIVILLIFVVEAGKVVKLFETVMKKICFVLLCAACFASCVSRGTAERIETQLDSLAAALDRKDSLLGEVFAAVNAISDNLSAIKTRENILTVGNGESGKRSAEQINEDIAAIDKLLLDNRMKIEALERSAAQLRKAHVRIEGLERMIENLAAQLDVKNREVGSLKKELAQMGVQVETLSTQVIEQGERLEVLTTEKGELEADVADKTARLYAVYYIVGPQKELLDTQIVRKSGFIGRTLTVNEKRNLDSFTKGDSRFLDEIPVGHKNVTVVTSHPEDSYRLIEGEGKTVESLRILDPERFWEASKILIVSYK